MIASAIMWIRGGAIRRWIAAGSRRQLSPLRRPGVSASLIGLIFGEDIKDVIISWLVRTVIVNAFRALMCSLRV
jgi:hypothetical protein